jgi:DNA-binding MarR family transcriptional regulator
VTASPEPRESTDADGLTSSDSEADAIRVTRALTVLSNLVSAPFYVNTQVPFGISLTEWRALREIGAQPGITQTEIAEQTAQHIMTLSRSVRQLIRKGLIEGRVDPDDRRRTQLFTTDLGQELTDEMIHREGVQTRHIVNGIAPEEVDELSRIVAKLVHHVRNSERPAPPEASRDWRTIIDP